MHHVITSVPRARGRAAPRTRPRRCVRPRARARRRRRSCAWPRASNRPGRPRAPVARRVSHKEHACRRVECHAARPREPCARAGCGGDPTEAARRRPARTRQRRLLRGRRRRIYPIGTHAYALPHARTRTQGGCPAPREQSGVHRARVAAAAALARSLARAHVVWPRRWRWRWRSLTPHVTGITRVTRVHTHATTRHRARHRRCLSSPRTTGMRAVRRRRCSLARSIFRTRCGGGDGGGGGGRLHRRSCASRAPLATRARTHVITMHRARHRRCLFPPRTTGTRALRRRRRSLASSRAHAVWRWRWRSKCRSIVPCAMHATRAAHHTRVRALHHRASRVSPPFPVPPHDRHIRAAAAAVLARSLDRAHAVWRWRWRWRWRSETPRVTRVTRAARHTRAHARDHRASPASPSPPRA